jgi:hypothetical protein
MRNFIWARVKKDIKNLPDPCRLSYNDKMLELEGKRIMVAQEGKFRYRGPINTGNREWSWNACWLVFEEYTNETEVEL